MAKQEETFTGYVVLGAADGVKVAKGVIEAGLNDLLKSAQAKRSTMWVIIPVEGDVTPAIDSVLTWAFEQEVEYHIYRTADAEVDQELVDDATEVKVFKTPTVSAIKALVKIAGADAALVLYEEDSEQLIEFMGSAHDAGLRVLELTDGLEPITIGDGTPAEDPEPGPEPAAAPRKRRSAAADEPEDAPAPKAKAAEPEEDVDYASMHVKTLQKLGRNSGIEGADKMGKAELVAALSGEPAPLKAEVAAPTTKSRAKVAEATPAGEIAHVVVLVAGAVHVQAVDAEALREWLKSQRS